MLKDQDKMSALLQALVECIKNSSSTEIAALTIGEARLIIQPLEQHPRRDGWMHPNQKTPEYEMEELVKQLTSMESREAGVVLLDSFELPRRKLEMLARFLDLPIRKTDNAERLRDMIIETTIGTRLNSKAIRGD